MMGPRHAGPLLLLLAAAAPQPSRAAAGYDERFFAKPSEVIVLKTRKDWAALEKSNFAWVVAFYREGCGYCALLRPEWETAATQLKRYVRIAAVDVERSRELAGYAQQRYGFKVEGVPTIKTFTPLTKKKGKPLIGDYNGERKGKAVVQHARSLMPSYLLSSKAMKDLQSLSPGPLAVFFSDKAGASALTKALSAKFAGRLRLGVLRATGGGGGVAANSALAKRCGATPPGVCILYVTGRQASGAEEAAGGASSVEVIASYGRKLSILSLDNWLMDYVRAHHHHLTAACWAACMVAATTTSPLGTEPMHAFLSGLGVLRRAELTWLCAGAGAEGQRGTGKGRAGSEEAAEEEAGGTRGWG
jgi:thiol-disulfide isomerase/thioredoxin